MNPVKVAAHSSEDIEAAMILMQMATGLPCGEFGKNFKLPEVIQTKPTPKRASFPGSIAKVRSSVTKVLTPQPKKPTSIKVVNVMVPPKKRKMILKEIILAATPAKVVKLTTDAAELINPKIAPPVPSIVCVQAKATPKTKVKEEIDNETLWKNLRMKVVQEAKERQSRERETFDRLQTFFKEQPVNTAEFIQKFIRNV